MQNILSVSAVGPGQEMCADKGAASPTEAGQQNQELSERRMTSQTFARANYKLKHMRNADARFGLKRWTGEKVWIFYFSTTHNLLLNGLVVNGQILLSYTLERVGRVLS